jgi:HNH endonuclease
VTSFNNDRKACLVAALQDQGGVCFWCRCTLAVLDDVKSKVAFKCVSHHHATIMNADGESDILYIASADHLVPQSMGGWTDRDNIVASCKQCNEDRGEMHSRLKWYVIDATGFEPWRVRAIEARTRKALARKQQKRATVNPTVAQSAQVSRVIKLVKRSA